MNSMPAAPTGCVVRPRNVSTNTDVAGAATSKIALDLSSSATVSRSTSLANRATMQIFLFDFLARKLI